MVDSWDEHYWDTLNLPHRCSLLNQFKSTSLPGGKQGYPSELSEPRCDCHGNLWESGDDQSPSWRVLWGKNEWWKWILDNFEILTALFCPASLCAMIENFWWRWPGFLPGVDKEFFTRSFFKDFFYQEFFYKESFYQEFIRSFFTRSFFVKEFFYQECKRLHPLGRAGKAEEVATAIVFLASKVMMMLMMIRSTCHEKITHCV